MKQKPEKLLKYTENNYKQQNKEMSYIAYSDTVPETSDSFILHGDIFFTPALSEYVAVKSGYVICENGVSKGVFKHIPSEYRHLCIHNYADHLIIPGLVDLHTHAPQYPLCGTAMDLELMEWLSSNVFPEEAKYSDIKYADKSYKKFAEAIKNSATTHASIFATIHRNSTELLMDYMEKTGIVSYVGKVNMDRESPDILCEESALISASLTLKWITDFTNKYKKTKRILTPRFVPTCSPELLEMLGDIQTKTGLPVQSHLSENITEMEFVKHLEPNSEFYGDVYDRYSLFGKNHNNGKNVRTLMAHCVHSSEDELSLMKQNGVYIVHCPSSNTNLSSGIAPVRKYLDMGLNVGLGSDVAAGHTLSIFSVICQAIQVSKLYNHYIDNTKSPLTFNEAFYLATKGGGNFFGKVGSFENGYNFNAVVLDSSKLFGADEMSVEKAAEKAVYSSLDLHGIISKYVDGKKII